MQTRTRPTTDPDVSMDVVGDPPTRITYRHRVRGWLLRVVMVVIGQAGDGLATIEVVLRAPDRFPAADRAAMDQLQRRLLAAVLPALTRAGAGVMLTIRPQRDSEEDDADEGGHAGPGDERTSG